MSIVKTSGLSATLVLVGTFAAHAACGFEDKDSYSLFSDVVGTGYHHIDRCYDAGIRRGGRDNGQHVVDAEGNRLMFVCGSQITYVRSRSSAPQNTTC